MLRILYLFALYCCDNHKIKNNLRRKEFISAYSLKSIMKRCQDRKSRQEPQVRNWSRGLGAASVACSACSVIAFRTTCLRVALPTVGWTVPHQSLIKNMLHRLAHRPIWWKHLLNRGSLLKWSSWQNTKLFKYFFHPFVLRWVFSLKVRYFL